jgi:hypothetical protein
MMVSGQYSVQVTAGIAIDSDQSDKVFLIKIDSFLTLY